MIKTTQKLKCSFQTSYNFQYLLCIKTKSQFTVHIIKYQTLQQKANSLRMSNTFQQTKNFRSIPLIEETFFHDNENVEVSMFSDELIVKTNKDAKVIKFNFDTKFEIIHDRHSAIGFKIFQIKPQKLFDGQFNMETGNPEAEFQEGVFFFKKCNWQRAKQWEQALLTKITKIGFSDKFTVISKVGQGNFSQVFLIQQIKTFKKFAAKKILSDKLNNPKDRRSLENQIKLLRMMDHENISKIYGVYQENSTMYVVLEYIEGTTLQRYIAYKKKQSKKYITKDDIAKILRQILKAVRYMSKKHILHRDLKPQNILLTQKKEVKIIDMNLATLVNEKSYLFVRCGTAGYVAPQILKIKDEQFNQCRLHTISDIFSVGTVFFKMMFGENLFNGSTQDIVRRNYKCQYELTEEMKKRMTFNQINLLVKMLDPNPSTRITPTQCLNHPYFEKFFVSDNTKDTKETEVEKKNNDKENKNILNLPENFSHDRCKNLEKSNNSTASTFSSQSQNRSRKKSFADNLKNFGLSIFSN